MTIDISKFKVRKRLRHVLAPICDAVCVDLKLLVKERLSKIIIVRNSFWRGIKGSFWGFKIF